MKNRFQRGSGCFKCLACGRRTRSTGDNGDVQLCPECYEECQMENQIADSEVERLKSMKDTLAPKS